MVMAVAAPIDGERHQQASADGRADRAGQQQAEHQGSERTLSHVVLLLAERPETQPAGAAGGGPGGSTSRGATPSAITVAARCPRRAIALHLLRVRRQALAAYSAIGA